MKTLGLDADGVLLDYFSGVVKWASSEGVPTYCLPAECDCYTMWPLFRSTEDETRAIIERYNSSEAFGQVPIFDGAVSAVRRLRERFEGLRLVAISSAGTTRRTEELRRQNLAAFGFDAIRILPLGASKKDAMMELLQPGDVFVDDLEQHVLTAEALGIKGVLARTPYNRKVAFDHSFDGWSEAEDVIAGRIAA